MGKVPFHLSVAACAAALLPTVTLAASDAEVAALRAEIARVKAEYAERISKLEAMADQLQMSGDTGATAAVDASLAAVAGAGRPGRRAVRRRAAGGAGRPAGSGPGQRVVEFNPAISVILTGNYANLSQDPADYHIAGVPARR